MKKITFISFIKSIGLLFCIGCLPIHQANAQTDWVQVPSPDVSATRNMLRGISGTSSSDIWTVGSYEELFNVTPYNKQNDLIMHWNGTGWFTYPPLNLSTTLDDLFDVEAIAPNNVWAVGIYNHATNASQAELLHFNGTSWQAQNPPIVNGGSGLFSLDATAPNDIWAAGAKTSSPTRPAYVLHYNGSSWSDINVPPVGLYRNQFESIDAISPTDVWAAGFRGETTGDFHAMVMRWNGTSWQNIALPAAITNPQSDIISIKAISANDVWAVGYFFAGGGFKIHWDGSTWTQMPVPNGGGGAFAAVASNNVYSVGSEIWHWDGSAWTLNDPLAAHPYPSLVNAVTFPNGDIWACGISLDADSNFHTLVYRNGNQLANGFNGEDKRPSVTIAPNPASSKLEVALVDSGAIDLVVVDAVGKVLQKVSAAGTATVAIDVTNYANGTYFVRIEGASFSEVKKFMISR
jgi:hypothetical protein